MSIAGHTLGNSAAWLHAHLHVAHANWAPRAALVVQSPLGLALPRHWQPLVGPLVPHRPVQTLADFSARRSDKPGASGSGSRCFADMLVCSGDHELQSTNVWQVRGCAPGRLYPGTLRMPVHARMRWLSSLLQPCSVPPSLCCLQASQALVALNSPLPKSPIETALVGCDGTCLRVLFLTRSPKPFMRQASAAAGCQPGSDAPTLSRLQLACFRYTIPCMGPAPAWLTGAQLGGACGAVQRLEAHRPQQWPDVHSRLLRLPAWSRPEDKHGR